jgi:hypothetical protein
MKVKHTTVAVLSCFWGELIPRSPKVPNGCPLRVPLYPWALSSSKRKVIALAKLLSPFNALRLFKIVTNNKADADCAFSRMARASQSGSKVSLIG